jgi:hypothetical protein
MDPQTLRPLNAEYEPVQEDSPASRAVDVVMTLLGLFLLR